MTTSEPLEARPAEAQDSVSGAPVPKEPDHARLRRGDSGAAVAEVRSRLRRLGYLTSPLPEDLDDLLLFDGEVDSAVRSFQQDRGITVDGVVGPVTFRRLEEARWRLGDRVLSYRPVHMTAGDDVQELQRRLHGMGFMHERIDGLFGPATDAALREFQRNVGINVDGTCGPSAFAALDQLAKTVTGGNAASLREEAEHLRTRTGVFDKVVVLDPGDAHGDAELAITSDLVQRIEGRLGAIGTQVLLTRPVGSLKSPPDATSMPDYEAAERARADFANESGAHLVVSIHLDSQPESSASGVCAFYYGSTRSLSVLGHRFAELVVAEIVGHTGQVDCRTHGKTWELLRATQMPAVRVDCGYLSNPAERQLLESPAFRDELAAAIASAIVAFFAPSPAQ